MEFFALPGIEANTSFDLERTSKGVISHYVETAKERILKDGDLAPVAILLSETKERILYCGTMMADNDAKDKLAYSLRQIALEMEAIAFIFIAEAWTAQYDKDSLAAVKVAPSEHPDRIECVMISAQYKGDRPTMRVAEIVRDPWQKITHLLEKDIDDDKDMSFEGRFAGVLDDVETDPFAGAKRWG